jgi:isoleucyl-tRNA synthetase
MLTRAGKKISKYGNFPEITDINKFLEKYSWEHLKLLYLSANIGQAIDFDQKIIDVSKLVIKKKNVLLFLEQTDAQKKLPADERSETEMEIVKSCQKLIRKLSQLELFEFYSSYHDLWFDLLSRRYISELRNNQGSNSGLKKIRELLPTIL